MRVPLVLGRRLPPHPRVLHSRPRFSNLAPFCRYSINTGSTENSQQQKPAQPEPLTNASSDFGAVGKYLLASVIAGGVGYAYAALNQSRQSQSQPKPQSQSQEPEGPRHGSPQDFKNVRGRKVVFAQRKIAC